MFNGESLKICPPAGRRPAGGPILKFSLLQFSQNAAQKYLPCSTRFLGGPVTITDSSCSCPSLATMRIIINITIYQKSFPEGGSGGRDCVIKV